MGRAGWMVLASLATLAAGGCAATRIENGVFHSAKGYRVAIPGHEWTVASESRADLELRHRGGRAGMLVTASCGSERGGGPLTVLARHLLSGLRDRSLLTREELSVNGKIARHAVVEGRARDGGEAMKIEMYVMRDERCVYDFLYAATPDVFDTWRPDFERLVRTFSTGGPS